MYTSWESAGLSWGVVQGCCRRYQHAETNLCLTETLVTTKKASPFPGGPNLHKTQAKEAANLELLHGSVARWTKATSNPTELLFGSAVWLDGNICVFAGALAITKRPLFFWWVKSASNTGLSKQQQLVGSVVRLATALERPLLFCSACVQP